MKNILKKYYGIASILLLVVSVVVCLFCGQVIAETSSGSVGLEGVISAPPPSQGATITVPGNGATFTSLPVAVQGICPTGLLVKIFKNDVFAGSQQCVGGSYSIDIDLFTGRNDLVAKVYDSLDQEGPISNLVTVTYTDQSTNANVANRVGITSSYAKRGAFPGETLEWPIVLTGGIGPYAISVDWGDGKTSLLSAQLPGEIILSHVYESPGIYKVVIKATDSQGGTAYLQMVAVGNGPLSQVGVSGDSSSGGSGGSGGGSGGSGNVDVAGFGSSIVGSGRSRVKIVWWPTAVSVPLIVSTFWFGKKYEILRIKRKIRSGQHPFKMS